MFDAFYAFAILPKSPGRRKIIYANDRDGTPFRNYGAGELKINMITWDEQHEQKWAHFLDANRTWLCGKKMEGKRVRRKTLLATYNDNGYVDPYPNGKTAGSGIRPPVNNMFPAATAKPAFEANPQEDDMEGMIIDEVEEDPELYLPGTRILFSSDLIRQYVWRELYDDSKKVIRDFMLGKYSASGPAKNGLQKAIHHVESAFYAVGYRINLEAAKLASRQAKNGRCIWETKAWKEALPYRVSEFLDEDYRILLDQLRAEVEEKRIVARREDTKALNAYPSPASPNNGLSDAPSGSRASPIDVDAEIVDVPHVPAVPDISEKPSLPPSYSSNTTFLRSRIDCDPKRIKINAWKKYSVDATTVISDFISGKLIAGPPREPGVPSPLAQIESAFYKYGFRIDTKAAMDASIAVKNGQAETVLDAKAWQMFPPVKLQPDKFSRVDTMLSGVEIMGELFVIDSSDDESARDIHKFDVVSIHRSPCNKLYEKG